MKSSKSRRALAFDFGASSGRAMLGEISGDKIILQEIHRFSNDPVKICGTLYWDVLRLFYEIRQGLIKAKLAGGFDSVGIDTWGVDFGLLDDEGRLIENPVHYRDSRTAGMIEESFKYIPRQRFYDITGNQFMELNTVFQLLSIVKQRPHIFDRAQTMLLMPDLFNYLLTGVKSTEYTIASTTQLLDAKNKTWSEEIVQALGIPGRLLTQIAQSGTVIGKISQELCEELDIPPADVIAVASHDTQSAVVAIPSQEKDFVFLSCGTWSLMGTELDAPLINEKSSEFNITNEGGAGNKTTFLKNIIGLWLIQESRRQWQREGNDYSYAKLEDLALSVKPFESFIDPDAPEFVAPGNIPKRVREFCERTNQAVPETVGDVMRCIYQSLAMKYRYSLEQIESCTGKTYSTIHVVGGGVKDRLLCQMTADACGRQVNAGPIEATVLGNIAVQLMASGEIASLADARRLIANSEKVTIYQPQEFEAWNKAYKRFKNIVKSN